MMQKEELEGKLTPAGQQVLNEIVKDYRAHVLLGANSSAANYSGEVKEISVHDILKSMRGLGGQPLGSLSRNASTLLRMYRWTGILISAVSSMYLLYVFASEQRTARREIYAIAAMISGLLLMIVSEALPGFFRMVFPKSRRETGSERDKLGYAQQYLSYWSNMEAMLRDIVSSQYGESLAHGPLSMLVQRGVIKKLIGKDEEGRFMELLALRNKIAHEEGHVNIDEIRRGIREFEILLKKLSSMR